MCTCTSIGFQTKITKKYIELSELLPSNSGNSGVWLLGGMFTMWHMVLHGAFN